EAVGEEPHLDLGGGLVVLGEKLAADLRLDRGQDLAVDVVEQVDGNEKGKSGSRSRQGRRNLDGGPNREGSIVSGHEDSPTPSSGNVGRIPFLPAGCNPAPLGLRRASDQPTMIVSFRNREIVNSLAMLRSLAHGSPARARRLFLLHFHRRSLL